MSTKADELILAVERGERVEAIRKARGMTGEEFAALAVKAAKAIGVRLALDKFKLSRVEGGKRKITVEEAAIFSELDPSERGIVWLVFGDVSKAVGRDRFRKIVG